jgi:nucleotide-binding universal stress UspA family protein
MKVDVCAREETMKNARRPAGRPLYQIAVPTDFLPASTSAMKFAQNLARAPGTRVTAVHTIDSLEYSFGPKDLRELKKQQMWALAQETMARWLQEGGFSSCATSMIEGEAAPAIAQFVEADGIDLIVLSTSARLRAARIAFGSVAEEIFRKATCPVFVLGPKVRPRNQPLTRLVFATDLEPHSLAALSHLSTFARKFNCSVSVIRAVHPDIQPRTEQSRIRKETEEKIKAAADPYLRKRIGMIRVEFAHPAKAITSFANRLKASAIVMGVRGGGDWDRATTHFPWALAHRIIAQAKHPVLTIRG